jgi:hypothetical protein
LSVSVHTFVRTAAVVFESVAVGLPSEQVAALPKPTRSIRLGLVAIVGHPVNAVVVFASATFPAVALNASEPVASGVGRFVVPADPADSCTNRYCPGCSVNVGNAVTCHELPVELAYCTLHPATETGAAVGLNNSIKSFLYVAPEFPPPPYTCEITTEVSVAANAVPLRAAKVEKSARRNTERRDERRCGVMAGY